MSIETGGNLDNKVEKGAEVSESQDLEKKQSIRYETILSWGRWHEVPVVDR
jgi:hypothetical protein